MSEKDMEYIRVAAYYMWENAGKPEGKDEEFWWKACEQLGSCCCAKKESKPVAKKAPAKKAVAKVSAKSVAKLEAKPLVKAQAKPALKAVAKKATKSKISPVPVKSATKIITPLYGSVKK